MELVFCMRQQKTIIFISDYMLKYQEKPFFLKRKKERRNGKIKSVDGI